MTEIRCLHVACVISIGSPSWFKTEIFPVLRHNRKPHSYSMYLNCGQASRSSEKHGQASSCRAAIEYIVLIWDVPYYKHISYETILL